MLMAEHREHPNAVLVGEGMSDRPFVEYVSIGVELALDECRLQAGRELQGVEPLPFVARGELEDAVRFDEAATLKLDAGVGDRSTVSVV